MAILNSSADPLLEDQHDTTEQLSSDTEAQIQLAPAPVPAVHNSSQESDHNTLLPIPSITSPPSHGGSSVFSNAPPQPPPTQNVPLPPPQNANPSPESEIAKIYSLLNELLEQLSINRQASIQLHSLATGVKVCVLK
jgi:hypothetical protein